MFSVNLERAEHTKRYSIRQLNESGWEVRLEEDSELTHRACYRDWHRVELAMAVVKLKVSDLTSRGWALSE